MKLPWALTQRQAATILCLFAVVDIAVTVALNLLFSDGPFVIPTLLGRVTRQTGQLFPFFVSGVVAWMVLSPSRRDLIRAAAQENDFGRVRRMIVHWPITLTLFAAAIRSVMFQVASVILAHWYTLGQGYSLTTREWLSSSLSVLIYFTPSHTAAAFAATCATAWEIISGRRVWLSVVIGGFAGAITYGILDLISVACNAALGLRPAFYTARTADLLIAVTLLALTHTRLAKGWKPLALRLVASTDESLRDGDAA